MPRKMFVTKLKSFLFGNALYVIATAAILAIGIGGQSPIGRVQGEETPPYSLNLDSTNTPSGLNTETFVSGLAMATARYVNFDYSQAKLASEKHVVIGVDGYIANNSSTRITSILSITATFIGGEATLTTGWRVYPNTNTQPLTSGVGATFTNDPYYFLITNTGTDNLSLTSLTITYSCAPTEEAGGTTYFGMYPQSKVTDSTVISTLNTSAGGVEGLPTSGSNKSWTDYGYYISGSISSFMWYIDLINQNIEYRGVYFTTYRPYYTTGTSSTSNSYQDDNGYTMSFVYWFKYEPITWRVLDVVSGKAFLMANLVIDSQDYYYSTSNRTISGATVYPNNYKESHIRSWLNDNFYNTAFTAEEKVRIQTTTVDNSVASTGYNPNTYACANTSDKVFLLSYVEATSAAYGLSTTTSRQLAPSAYAKSQGVYTYTNGFNYWWLRSPYDYLAGSARYVSFDGSFTNNYVYRTSGGVVPALWISL
ncbi:MAG TPA: DUF6273 domain-containing protein [Bacilli bacterium]|nr:DUF6273 domain-containing protein [Bacilli bacterium]